MKFEVKFRGDVTVYKATIIKDRKEERLDEVLAEREGGAFTEEMEFIHKEMYALGYKNNCAFQFSLESS